MSEWNKIFHEHNKEAIPCMPTASDADQFGHVIWFNPTTGTIVAKWNQPSVHYTHWRKTDVPDVVGQKFHEWRDKQIIWSSHPNIKLFESAFRAGAAIR